MKKILLFDMDGVLLTPGGYHTALRDTVALLGRSLGFAGVELTAQQIAAFEACGVTNEWDSAAICLALMADVLHGRFPDVEIEPGLVRNPVPAHDLVPPNIDAFVDRLADPERGLLAPLARAASLLPEKVHHILDSAYSIDGLSQRIQQEHVLGSAAFSETYGIPAHLNVPSYLMTHDRSNVTPKLRRTLLKWLKSPEHRAVIFTNRPSMPPEGIFGTPEAEQGAALVGLEMLPLMGTGGIVWLEYMRAAPPSTYNKPHPVHALGAIASSAGHSMADAMKLAASLALDGRVNPLWETVEGAEIWVFEDSTGGIESLNGAKKILQGAGVQVEVHPIGVSNSPIKKEALERARAEVYPNLKSALKKLTN